MAFRARNKQRDFKKGIDADDSRRRRADVTVELRKKTRDEQVMKRRMKASAPVESNENNNNANLQNTLTPTVDSKLSSSDIAEKLKQLPQLVAAVNSNNGDQQLAAVTEFRKLLFHREESSHPASH